MAISTYTNLCTAVANWLARDDLTSRIPEFITLFEAKANRELRCPQMEKRSYTSVDTGNTAPEFISLPGDFQTMRRLRLSGVTGKPRLANVSGQQADLLRYSIANASGQPEFFTIIGNELELIPTPGQDYELEMIYRANLDPLDSDTASNWLLDLAPDAYLYGALLEAAPYMKDDNRIAVWAAGLTTVFDGLNRLGMEQSYMSGPMSVRIEGPVP